MTRLQVCKNRIWRGRRMTWILIKVARGGSICDRHDGRIEREKKKTQMKLTFRAGLKGWMHHVVNGYSSQTPFHYSRNEYGHEGAHGTGASRLTHACVYSCVHVFMCFVRLCAWTWYFRAVRVVLSGRVYCVLGWLSAAALAAPRSRRIREVALLKWSWSICERERVCVILCLYRPWIIWELCVSHSLKGNWIRLKEILAPD